MKNALIYLAIPFLAAAFMLAAAPIAILCFAASIIILCLGGLKRAIDKTDN